MKKIIVLLLSLSLFLPAIAQDTPAEISTGKEIWRDVKSGTTTLYQDMKSAMSELAEALKVGAEHVYIVLVKQQVVKAITYTSAIILSLIFAFMFYKLGDKIPRITDNYSGKKEISEGTFFCWLVSGIFSLTGICLFACTIDIIVTGFVNPEYGAMQEILQLIKK